MASNPSMCALCDRLADDALILGTASTYYTQIPLCHAHLAALRLDDWWMTIKLLDTYATTSGHEWRVPEDRQEGHLP